MAILSGGPNSGFSGKAGSMVGYYRMGKWVVRGLPRLSPKNKKGSVKQNIYRKRFTALQQLLRLIMPVIRIGFGLVAKENGNTAHNSATSWNMLHAFDENGNLDYANLRISSGRLAGAEDAAASLKDGVITITWHDNSVLTESFGLIVPRPTDQVILLAYHTGEHAQMIVSGAWRSACLETLPVPNVSKTDNSWHVWIAFAANDRLNVSDSQYLGVVREE